MTWRGTVTPLERLYGSLPYALPIAASVIYGSFLFQQFPVLQLVYLPFILLFLFLNYPILPPLLSVNFLVFIGLYFFVIRNERITHFVRFNVMQALILDISLSLISILNSILGPVWTGIPQILFVGQILANTIFIGITAVCVYCIFQTIKGAYADIPIISEAAYYQTRS